MTSFDFMPSGLIAPTFYRLRFNQALLAQPAAGADWSLTITDFQTIGGMNFTAVQIITMSARLVCSATVANRFVNPSVSDGAGNAVYQIGAKTAQVASQTWRYSWVPGFGGDASTALAPTGVVVQPLPDPCILTENGGQLSIVTSGLQVGDRWTLPFVEYAVLGG